MNGCQWSQEIADFCAWTVRYDMWCKMRFFEDMLHADLEGERTAVQRGPVSLLNLLPNEFTREQVRELRIAHGKKPDPKLMIDTWVKREKVVRDKARNVYRKVGSRQLILLSLIRRRYEKVSNQRLQLRCFSTAVLPKKGL